MWPGMVYIKKKGQSELFFCMFTSSTEHYTLEVTGSQIWPDYIGPRGEKAKFV